MKLNKVLLEYQYFDYKQRVFYVAHRILGNQEKAKEVMAEVDLNLKKIESCISLNIIDVIYRGQIMEIKISDIFCYSTKFDLKLIEELFKNAYMSNESDFRLSDMKVRLYKEIAFL